ncbi:CPBP family intramembrane glutamic endopeptidase [Streptomyces sp. NPDC048639]|uniref:CPBP family intramembrane glutamic endopeptidase n=1 Tax=Streptomyces sp. NPDC048639 TaxID=3365581 RepID=UPI003721BC41
MILVTKTGAHVAGDLLNRPEESDGSPTWGVVGDAAVGLLGFGLIIPVVLLTTRWVGRRPAGTVSSVSGRVRWRWLMVCLAVALPVSVGTLIMMATLASDTGGTNDVEMASPSVFLLGLAMAWILVPFQAAGEEYMYRGWLLQAAGSWLRSPWIAMVPQALLFAASHGWGTPWGFIDLTVFGLVTAFLAIRTGGIEAGIALHVFNNVLAMSIAALSADGLVPKETAADMGWLKLAADGPMVVLYALFVLWLFRRRDLDRVRMPAG